MDSAFNQRLCELIRDHKVDTILEEAAGLHPKACVELLADELNVRWLNIDISAEKRKLVADSALTSMYDTLQDLNLHTQRENVWLVEISKAVTSSGLVICGLCHVLSLSEKARWLDFEVEAQT